MYTQAQIKTVQNGVVPVMLTPFNPDLSVDYPSLEKLIEWYLDSGAVGLFAACQSSEIMHLSDQEIQDMVRFIVEKVANRVPVIASGHTADTFEGQMVQLNNMIAAGVDGVVLITNRLGDQSATDSDVIQYMEKIANALPADMPLGLYECPAPWKRLLSDYVLEWCINSKRFTFLKDTCCSLDILQRRLALAKNSPFKIYNANGPTLLGSLRMGAAGYSGVMANYHCDLYSWLCLHYDEHSELVEDVADFLAVTSLGECVTYPVSAKYAQKRLGNLTSTASRTVNEAAFYQGANTLLIDQLQRLADRYNQKIANE